jgi:hypothetical protein
MKLRKAGLTEEFVAILAKKHWWMRELASCSTNCTSTHPTIRVRLILLGKFHCCHIYKGKKDLLFNCFSSTCDIKRKPMMTSVLKWKNSDNNSNGKCTVPLRDI